MKIPLRGKVSMKGYFHFYLSLEPVFGYVACHYAFGYKLEVVVVEFAVIEFVHLLHTYPVVVIIEIFLSDNNTYST